MDMAVVSAPAAPAAQSKSSSQAVESTNATAPNNGQFKDKLAGSMKDANGANANSAAKTETASTTAVDQTDASQSGSAVPMTAEQIVAAIGELLQALQENTDQQQTSDADAQETLQLMLDQMNAMLTLLGQQPVQPLPQVPGFEVEDLKADVAQALVSLQQTIDRGQLGAAKLGNVTEWLGSQLQVLQQTMQQLKAPTEQSATQEDELLSSTVPQASSANESASTPAQPQTTVTVKAVSLLDQLNRNAVSPNLLQVIAEQQQTSEQTVEPTVSLDAGPVAINLNAQAQEAARTLTLPRTIQVTQQVPVQQFAETMANLMVNKFEVKTAVGMSEARLTLTPEHLGQVDVRISMHNGQLTALFLTDSSAAKEMLDNQLALLRANLQSQGLNVEKLEVSQQSYDNQMAQQQHGGSGKQQSNSGSGTHEGSETEQSTFEAELTEQSVIRELGFGRGINVRA